MCICNLYTHEHRHLHTRTQLCLLRICIFMLFSCLLVYTVHTLSLSLSPPFLCMYGLYEYLFKRFDQRSASPLAEHEYMLIVYSTGPGISFSYSLFFVFTRIVYRQQLFIHYDFFYIFRVIKLQLPLSTIV